MLSISKLKNPSQALSYYEKDDNYYTNGEGTSSPHLSNSEWFGGGLEHAGIDGGPVDPKVFSSLLHGNIGETQLGRVRNGELEHAPGWDLTFSAPKSVSLLIELGNDARLLEAHKRAVKEALTFLEGEAAQTRSSVRGEKSIFTQTDNLLVALFHHNTSRASDPQIHTHSVIMNATHTGDKWKSLSSERLFDLKMAAGLRYRSNLMRMARELGYEIDVKNKQLVFEIKGVPSNVIETFSKRRSQIEKALADKNLDGAVASSVATLDTRSSKKSIDRDLLAAHWKKELDSTGFDFSKVISNANLSLPASTMPGQAGVMALNQLDFALSYLSEREASFSKVELLNTAIAHSQGTVSDYEIELAFNERVADGGVYYKNGSRFIVTTKQAMDIERDNVMLSLSRAGAVKPFLEATKASGAVDKKVAELEGALGIRFTGSQVAATKNVLSCTSGIQILEGKAGVGKSTSVNLSASILASKGFHVRAMAPSGAAANVLAEDMGIPATTVDQFLINLETNTESLDKKSVLVIDESSMLSSRQMNRVLKQVERHGARAILIGDTGQLESVEAGRPLAQLKFNGVNTSTISEIIRQRDPYLKQAVSHAIDNEFARSLGLIRSNAIVSGSLADRRARIANMYTSLNDNDRADTMILCPANEDRHAINQLVRDRLFEKSLLSTSDNIDCFTLENRDRRIAELKIARYYGRKDIIRFGKADKSLGIKSGDYYFVTRVNDADNTITVSSLDEKSSITFDPSVFCKDNKKRVEVYTLHKTNFAVGDEVRFTRSDKEIGVTNGERGKVVSASANTLAIVKPDGKIIDLNHRSMAARHLTYSYVDTAYSAQGQSKSKVIAHLESFRRNLVTKKSAYIAISRAKDSFTLVTDDIEKLSKTVPMRSGANTIAIDKVIDKALDKDSYRLDKGSIL